MKKFIVLIGFIFVFFSCGANNHVLYVGWNGCNDDPIVILEQPADDAAAVEIFKKDFAKDFVNLYKITYNDKFTDELQEEGVYLIKDIIEDPRSAESFFKKCDLHIEKLSY